MAISARWLFLLVFFVCVAMLGYGLYLQEAKNLLPCPLCVVQRIAYWLVGLTALIAFLHNPGVLGRRAYAAAMGIWAFAGAMVALRHVWLLRHPNSFTCGVSPEERFLNALPFAKWWPSMFEANGDCALIKWRFLNLTIPDWSLIVLLLLTAVAVYLGFMARRSS